MVLPAIFTDTLKGLPGYEEVAFEAVHAAEDAITSVRLNHRKITQQPFAIPASPVPWARHGYYLEKRPSFTFDPLFHAGTYYVQEASSMLLEQALSQHTDLDKDIRILDLCAAPGGKSTHIQSLVSPGSLLVSNEVIRSRASVLRDNIIKWGGGNVVVLNNDPAHFNRIPGYFDAMVVDAPCSGSGLFRRDPDALNEWSPEQVSFCSQRQKRILADVLPSLKENGLLVYSTCSYSVEEDELLLEWLMSEYDLESLPLELSERWQVVEVKTSNAYGYRCWPHLLKGEGFFLGVFRKKEGGTGFAAKSRPVATRLTPREAGIVETWMDTQGWELVKKENTVFAWPASLTANTDILLDKMQVVYAGIRVGELLRDKLVPDHALAMSGFTRQEIERTGLTEAQAILYLQRKEFQWPGNAKGWQLATYKGHIIGWANVLPNRFNNYYPKELRILKDK